MHVCEGVLLFSEIFVRAMKLASLDVFVARTRLLGTSTFNETSPWAPAAFTDTRQQERHRRSLVHVPSIAKIAAQPPIQTMGGSNEQNHDVPVRWNINEEVKATLQEVYNVTPYPSSEARRQLADQFGVSSKQVQVWFRNQRQRDKHPYFSGQVPSQNGRFGQQQRLFQMRSRTCNPDPAPGFEANLNFIPGSYTRTGGGMSAHPARSMHDANDFQSGHPAHAHMGIVPQPWNGNYSQSTMCGMPPAATF
eukprot:6212827-Pleurochrysis_carterae.AAC.1